MSGFFCEKLIEASEGKIWFESELVKGTTFYFTY
jgi:signal transduction histidine kinase